MGFLTLASGLPNMNTATISVWFRIPTAAAEARRAESPGLYWDFDVMTGVIPLLVFGDQQTGQVYEWKNEQVGTDILIDEGGVEHPQAIYGIVLHGPRSAPMPPSWIGVAVGSTASPFNPPSLSLHLQTSDIAIGANLSYSVVNYVPFVGPSPDIVSDPLGVFTTQDTSFATLAAPVSIEGVSLDVDLDQWHHLLISWDLQGGNDGHGTTEFGASTASGTGNFSLLWVALDDENKTESDLPAYWVDGGDPNAVVCTEVGRVAGGHQEKDIHTVTVSFSDLPAIPLCIPAKEEYDQSPGVNEPVLPATTEPVERIEMAELQIFCGVSLDTSSAINRRAFVDYKLDENGERVKYINSDGEEKDVMLPVDPDKAKELMGRRPHVLLHGSSKWKEGRNTGSLGLEDDETVLPPGQFAPTGTITPYKPDPELGK
jgi:hypothetical protein